MLLKLVIDIFIHFGSSDSENWIDWWNWCDKFKGNFYFFEIINYKNISYLFNKYNYSFRVAMLFFLPFINVSEVLLE